MKKKFFASAAVASLVLASMPVTTFAYNGSAAATYADKYYSNYNTNYPSFSSDCTNFVSQALNNGGLSMVNTDGSTSNNSNWFCWGPYSGSSGIYWTNTNSWSAVSNFMSFLYNSNDGTFEASDTNMSDPYPPTWGNPTGVGDVCFYNWTATAWNGIAGNYSHATILVGTGTDPDPAGKGYSGALVDAHTSNHYHAIWTLAPYNANWATTEIGIEHIN